MTQLRAIAFALGSALVGVAAVLIAPMYAIQPGTGDTFGVIAFIVVILGGLGSVAGGAAAAMLTGIGQSVFAIYLPSGLLGLLRHSPRWRSVIGW